MGKTYNTENLEKIKKLSEKISSDFNTPEIIKSLETIYQMLESSRINKVAIRSEIEKLIQKIR